MCITTNQPNTKYNPKPTTKQHAIVSIRLNIGRSHMSHVCRETRTRQRCCTVVGWQTFPDLRLRSCGKRVEALCASVKFFLKICIGLYSFTPDLIYGWHVTNSWVKCPLWVNKPGQLSHPSLHGRYMDYGVETIKRQTGAAYGCSS